MCHAYACPVLFTVQVKAVTLQGAVISKSGTMTGGTTAKDADRAGRWDEQVHSAVQCSAVQSIRYIFIALLGV